MSALRIWNPIRNTVLAERAEVARSHRERAKGLLGKKALPEGAGLLLQGTRSIHTFGMQFPIDVIYLDAGQRVLRTVSALSANRIGPIRRGVCSVLELPAGSIERSQTQVSDFLKMNDCSE